MLINAVTEKMPDKYIVASSGVAGYGDNNEIRRPGSPQRFSLRGSKDRCSSPGGSDGTEGGDRCPPSSQYRPEDSFG